ncbi:uncharacterized protein LOC143193808 isoform X1 [Rhynchophorus ferrugineus]|uniref:uncharacterized protein LOC143193808 isoform X1 n=2 Tax=Rhynchophorus ferrugineus TaxID=354439 RepID=UPI003FCD77F4
MGPSLKPCCVPGCYDNTSNRYTIPTNKDCRTIWLTRIKNKSLFGLDHRQISSRKVCASHFEDVCLINGRLRKFALPTMNLPSYEKTNDCFFNKNLLTDSGTDDKTKACEMPGSSDFSLEAFSSTRKRVNEESLNTNETNKYQKFEVIEKSCCICLKRGIKYNKVSRKTDTKVALLTKLKTCIPEIIWSTFFYICEECTSTLNICYEFRETCLKSDFIRKKELKTNKNNILLKTEWATNIEGETSQNDTVGDDVNDGLKEESNDFDPDEPMLNNSDNSVSEDFIDDSNAASKTETFKNDTNEETPNNSPKKRKRVTFRCEKCSVYFSSSVSLLNHCTTEHDMDPKEIKPFACDRCPMKFYSSSNLWQHVKYHNGVKSNICSYCGNGFITKTDLVNHEKKHQNKREYKCELCQKTFNTHKNIRSHKLIVHTDPSLWKYACSICGKRFPIKSNYDSHMRRHTGEKNFDCHLCDKKFTTKCDLQRHKRSHSYVRDQKCPIQNCNKEYKDERVLKIHVAKVHGIGTVKVPVKEKRHVCHFCSKAYYDKNKLTRHLYTHSGEKPFNCPVCDKKFNDKSYIKQHLRNTHNVDTNNTLETELNINYMNRTT